MFSIGEKVRVLRPNAAGRSVTGTVVTVYDETEHEAAVEVNFNNWAQGWYLASELTVDA